MAHTQMAHTPTLLNFENWQECRARYRAKACNNSTLDTAQSALVEEMGLMIARSVPSWVESDASARDNMHTSRGATCIGIRWTDCKGQLRLQRASVSTIFKQNFATGSNLFRHFFLFSAAYPLGNSSTRRGFTAQAESDKKPDNRLVTPIGLIGNKALAPTISKKHSIANGIVIVVLQSLAKIVILRR